MSGLLHGSLDGQRLDLLTANSHLRYGDQIALFSHKARDGDYVYALEGGQQFGGFLEDFTYIGERDADGWIHAPEGGWSSNPVPRQMVEVRQRWARDMTSGGTMPGKSENRDWPWRYEDHDILAFRLAHPAPEQVAEASGREGERDYPEEFERWWLRYKHRNRDMANYSVKKQIAFDAFYFATPSPGVSRERIEGAGEDNPFTFDFVQALSKATFDQKFGLNAWRDTNDDVRRVWINQTQDVIQTARLEADLSARGGA